MTDRRQFIGMCLGSLAAGASGAGAAPGPVARSTPLGPDLWLLQGHGNDIVALSSPEGLLLVDSGAPSRQRALHSALRRLPGGPRVRTLVNTHAHPEATGGNEQLGKAGTHIIAHEKTLLALSHPVWDPRVDRYRPPLAPRGRPVETLRQARELAFGNERLEIGHLLQAHTEGDLFVHFRGADVLVVGDAAAPVVDPVLDWTQGGWLGGRIDSLAALLRRAGEGTRIIAGTGGVHGRAQLQVEHDALARLYERSTQLLRKGYGLQDMLQAGVMRDLGRDWQDAPRLLDDVLKGLWAHHNTISHDIV